MSCTIYSLIDSIDKEIKKQKLYLDILHHGFGKFNFQSILSYEYNKYQPFWVNQEKILKLLKTPENDFSSYSFSSIPHSNSGWLKAGQENYLLLDNQSSASFFKKNFLHTGIYFLNAFVSEKGHIIVATYSPTLEPQIFETKVKMMPKQTKERGSFFSSLINYNPFELTPNDNCMQEWTFSLKFNSQYYNGRQLRLFMKSNEKLSIREENKFTEKLDIVMNPRNEFSWDKIFKCIKKLSTDYFNDTDVNIFHRADMVAYLLQNSNRVEIELQEMNHLEKKNILSVFEENKEYLNLFSQSINLQENQFYKKIPSHKVFDSDYGACAINQMSNFIKLQMMLGEIKTIEYKPLKRNKI